MHKVLIAGAGKIGSTIAHILAHSTQYKIYLADLNLNGSYLQELKKIYDQLDLIKLDLQNIEETHHFMQLHRVDAVVSSLPYFCNVTVAEFAKRHHLHYFDLTEDVKTTQAIAQLAQNNQKAFIPQCGIAPGLINIIANHLMQHFEKLETVKLRCGALPQNASNALQYAITWSVNGLINEYGNPCDAIENGEKIHLKPLEGLEEIQIDGLNYEAFNTSGGISTLAETYAGKVKNISYKTMRYPGHCEKIRFLMNDLQLNQDRETLKKILQRALPTTTEDVVLIYIAVHGMKQNEFCKENYVRKFYPQIMDGIQRSAIQMITATGLCTILDLVLHHPENYHGWIKQEQFELKDILNNQFGSYLREEASRRDGVILEGEDDCTRIKK